MVVHNVFCHRKFHVGKKTVCNLEVNELYCSYSLSNSSVAPILIGSEIDEASCDGRISNVWIFTSKESSLISYEGLARELPGDEVVEQSESIPSV